MPAENYIKMYALTLQEIREETYQKYPSETGMLFEFIDNWIDLIPRDRERFLQATNSISGIILLNSWKLTNWITYEILNGRYFEAIRNLRFIFEGCVFAVILEDVIESTVFEKWGGLSALPLKAEIFRLWEECKRKRVCRKGKIDKEMVRRIVTNFVDKNIDPSKKEVVQEYVEVYTRILSNKKLYLKTSKMIEECRSFLKLDEYDVREMKKLWHELSKYLHFSYTYLEVIIEDPGFCFLERFNDKLFKLSLKFYLKTMDFLYTVLVWRFKDLREEINRMCRWWRNNFNKPFGLTEKTFRRLC